MSLPVHLIETEFWRQIVNSTRGVTSQMSHLNRPFDVSVLPQVDMCAHRCCHPSPCLHPMESNSSWIAGCKRLLELGLCPRYHCVVLDVISVSCQLQSLRTLSGLDTFPRWIGPTPGESFQWQENDVPRRLGVVPRRLGVSPCCRAGHDFKNKSFATQREKLTWLHLSLDQSFNLVCTSWCNCKVLAPVFGWIGRVSIPSTRLTILNLFAICTAKLSVARSSTQITHPRSTVLFGV